MEMLVSFISLLLKNDKIDIIEKLLRYKNITKMAFGDLTTPVNYTYFYKFLNFAVQRNERLQLNRASITADIIKDNFEDRKLKSLITFDEYKEADYFLHLFSIIQNEHWYPTSVIYLENPPEFLTNSYRKEYYKKLLENLNITNEQFINAIEASMNKFAQHMFFDLDFLRNFKIDNLGKF